MDLMQQLARVADAYRDRGYDTTVRPGPEQLPAFAKDFRVELVGRRGTEGVLVAVCRTRDELAADAEMPRYAEVTGSQPGWRFDFAILQPEDPAARGVKGGREFSEADVRQTLDQAAELTRIGYPRFALLGAWAAFEAAMRLRLRLRADGRGAGRGNPSGQMMRELYSAGLLSPDEFRGLEAALQFRNQIVHGFAAATDEPVESEGDVVNLLARTAHRLMSESKPLRVPA